MRKNNYLLDKYIAPIIATILSTLILSIASKIYRNNWGDLFKTIPKIYFIIFGFIIVIWILRISRKRKRKNKDIGIQVITSHTYGWTQIGKINYKDVIWNVVIPSPSPWNNILNSHINSSILDILIPPLCPKCETEIEENKSFWGGYIWTCVQCNFKKRNKDNIYKESERAKRIAKKKIKDEFENKV